jgi:nucleotide-binding universal stress UspA family protein
MISSSFKKIVVSTDFSAASENALKTAISMCQQHGSHLVLVHVIDNSIMHFRAQGRIIIAPVQHLVAIAKENLNTIAIAISREHSIFVSYEVLVGQASSEICQYADNTFADLIVIGKRNEFSAAHEKLGAVAFQVVKFSRIPVLCIPAGKSYHGFKKVIFPVLERTSIPRVEYNLIRAFVRRSSAMLVVAGIAKASALTITPIRLIRLLELIVKKTRHDGVRSSKRMSQCSNVPLEVVRISNEESADLIMLSSHSAKLNFSTANHPTARILTEASCPVLSLN